MRAGVCVCVYDLQGILHLSRCVCVFLGQFVRRLVSNKPNILSVFGSSCLLLQKCLTFRVKLPPHKLEFESK